MEVELSEAEQTASTEANAASAANDDDREVIMAGKEDSDTSEVDEDLLDYNELEAVEKAAEQRALREMLANNGFALRNILRSERVKSHFTSPFSKEDEMSVEDILLEIPPEDLHEVGMVQSGRVLRTKCLMVN